MKKLVQKIKDTLSILNSGKGFTLIELLVVVLIIGILAAIALPQYQLAVDKAEFTKYQAMVSSLRDAYDEYVLLHGVGTKNFNDLSFTMPDDFVSSYTGDFNCISNSKMFCCMSPSGSVHSGLINCGKSNLSVIYQQVFFRANNIPADRRGMCLAIPNKTRANRLCNDIGEMVGTYNTWTPEGYSNSYNSYVLK